MFGSCDVVSDVDDRGPDVVEGFAVDVLDLYLWKTHLQYGYGSSRGLLPERCGFTFSLPRILLLDRPSQV